jgi:ribosomal protein S18 acetylase RimI-like enzyme
VTPLIREANRKDLTAIGQLAGDLVRFHHALNPKRYLLVDGVDVGYARYFQSELSNPKSVILAAEDAGAIIGYAYGRLEPRDWNALLDACGAIHDIFVHPSARRCGIGKLLLDAVLKALEDKGAPRILLHTSVENAEAQALFEAAGFRSTMLEMTRETQR